MTPAAWCWAGVACIAAAAVSATLLAPAPASPAAVDRSREPEAAVGAPPRDAPPALLAFCDRSRPLPRRLPPDFAIRLPRVAGDAQVRSALVVLRDRGDDDALRHEAAWLLERSGCAEVVPALLALVDDPRETVRFRTFMAQHLGIVLSAGGLAPDQDVRPVLQRLATAGAAPAPVRREALLVLVQLRDEELLRQVMDSGLADERWQGVRDLVIRAWYAADRRDRAPELIAALAGTREEAIAAAFVLGEWRDAGSRAPLERAAASDHAALRQAARIALRKLGDG